jgi:hypothetical protein
MPAIANLSINDGQATPVAHSFVVSTTDGQKATWLEKAAGNALGYLRLTFSARSASTPTAADVTEITISQPAISTVDNVTTLARRSSCSIRFNFAQSAPDAERKDLVAFASNALANASVKAASSAVEPFY